MAGGTHRALALCRVAIGDRASRQHTIRRGRAASPRPSLLASNSCPTTQLPQRCPEISAAPTERHPASPLPETATGAHRRACQPKWWRRRLSVTRHCLSHTPKLGPSARCPASMASAPHSHRTAPPPHPRAGARARAQGRFKRVGLPCPNVPFFCHRPASSDEKRAGAARPARGVGLPGALTARAEISD